MKYLFYILTAFIISTGILSCDNNNENQVQLDGQNDIVIVGGDTLGRNWDNLPSKEEAEQAAALGLTPQQFMQMKDEQMKQDLLQRQQRDEALNQGQVPAGGDAPPSTGNYELPPTSFSEKMYQEKSYTVVTTDGREVVVGSSSSSGK